MSNELQKHKTIDTVKWVLALLAFILVGVMLAGIILGWFDKNDNPTKDVSEQAQTSSFGIGEIYNTQAMSLAVSTYAASSDVVSLSDSYTVKATVSPTTARNKKVDWSVAFVTPSATWAAGKTASNYITVTPSASDSSTATVTCKQAFGAQIKVVATSNDNTAISAYCVCEYYERINSVSGSFTGLDAFDTSKSVNEWAYTSSGKVSTTMSGDYNGLYEICTSFVTSNTAYTIAETLHALEVTLEPTQEFAAAMKAKYSSYAYAPVSFVANNGSVAAEIPLNYGTGCYFPLTGMTTLSGITGDPIECIMIADSAAEVLCENPDMCFMNVTVKVVCLYNDYECTFQVKAKQSSLPLSVTGLKVDNSTLNF